MFLTVTAYSYAWRGHQLRKFDCLKDFRKLFTAMLPPTQTIAKTNWSLLPVEHQLANNLFFCVFGYTIKRF